MGKGRLYITSRGRTFDCAVLEPVIWETQRKGSPGKLEFSVIKDEVLGFHEGDEVYFEYDGKPIFNGFVFTKKRSNNRIISVTAFDQLWYFKNKDTYTYKAKTASQVLQMLIKDFRLKTGVIADTKYVIASRVEDNTDLYGIMDNALSITTQNTGVLYVLYDDCGKLSLRDVKMLKLDLLIDAESGETFDYTSSIADNTYNRIKLSRENKETGKREIFIVQHGENINQWGMIQYTDKVEDGENGAAKAHALLSLYNQKSRQLHINSVFGDIRVRGGSLVGVQMYLGDLTVSNYMMVETVKHTFSEGDYRMDLKLIGGEFIA